MALESKRSWGYDDDFIELCRAELTLSQHDISSGLVFVAEDAVGIVVGFYMLSKFPRPEMKMLFVSPDVLGQGIGKELVRDALGVARSLGWKNLVIESEPFAASFYEHLGAQLVGTSPSESTGRTLPLYTMKTEE